MLAAEKVRCDKRRFNLSYIEENSIGTSEYVHLNTIVDNGIIDDQQSESNMSNYRTKWTTLNRLYELNDSDRDRMQYYTLDMRSIAEPGSEFKSSDGITVQPPQTTNSNSKSKSQIVDDSNSINDTRPFFLENILLNMKKCSDQEKILSSSEILLEELQSTLTDDEQRDLLAVYENDHCLEYFLSIAKFSHGMNKPEELVSKLKTILTDGKAKYVECSFKKLLQKRLLIDYN